MTDDDDIEAAEHKKNNTMTKIIQIKHQTTKYAFSCTTTGPSTVSDLQHFLFQQTSIPIPSQKLVLTGSRVDTLDPELDLRTLFTDDSDDSDSRTFLTMLLLTSSPSAVQVMLSAEAQAKREANIRQERKQVNIRVLNEHYRAPPAEYGFQTIEILDGLPEGGRARAILERLTLDRGIAAVMASHRWNVGTLAELYPEGKVGVDPVCVLGLNVNRGTKILLRLRTDDLLGFRKYLSIRNCLYHELAHNVHGDHDAKFYQLMRDIEKEASAFEYWTQGDHQFHETKAKADDDDVNPRPRRLGGSTLNLLQEEKDLGSTREAGRAAVARQYQVSNGEKRDSTTASARGVLTKESQENQDTGKTSKSDQIAADSDENRKPDEDHKRKPAMEADMRIDDRSSHMLHAAECILNSRQSRETLVHMTQSLLKIIQNLRRTDVDKKNEEAFRQIRLGNPVFQKRIGHSPHALELLRAMGFEHNQERTHLIFTRNDPGLLWLAQSIIEDRLVLA